ncbi:Ku protein [Bosea sp. (in: a-proteobacteria)]|jgi:DNA end-binding protein Ku|uniref:non-homologous end joining protein Ku n=1 Tax=Bosea sp. (in: a-proteobacteria) TaxID=1871050 RepID=UPI003F6FDEE2
MAVPRVNWRGYLKIGELSCPVALYTGASTSERISFHTINRETGNRVRREFIDPGTGKPVDREDQVKGYEVDEDRYVVLEPEEVAKAVPESNKTLAVGAFVACSEIDTLYFDKPYYLAPSGPMANDAFAVIREAMREMKVAALAHAVLFRRYRGVMIRAQGLGLVAHTLNFDYEVRAASTAFEDIHKLKIKGEMLDLAKHIIDTKRGEFDPAAFDDRYEAAVTELVKAKLEGKPIKRRKAPAAPKVVDLMEALRASASRAQPAKQRTARKAAVPQRKAS